MRNYLLFLLFLSPVTGSTQNAKCPGQPTFEYIRDCVFRDTVFNNRVKRLIIQPGRGYIFKYTMGWDCPEWHDDESSERLKWFVPDTVTEFSLVFQLADSMPPNIMWDYMAGGVARTHASSIAFGGTIHGIKNKNTWKVTAQLEVRAISKGVIRPGLATINFSSEFIEWDQKIRAGGKTYKLNKVDF